MCVLLQTNRFLSKVILQLRVQVQVKMTSITVKTTQLLIHFDVCVCVFGRAFSVSYKDSSVFSDRVDYS